MPHKDKDVVALMEAGGDMAASLAARAPFDRSGYRILTRSVSAFQPDRLLYDCLAFKLGNGGQKK